MNESTTNQDATTMPVCRRCGESMERGWYRCRSCGTSVAGWWNVRAVENHAPAMFFAVFSGVFSHAMMIEFTALNPIGIGSMLARLVVLGLPLAITAWNWLLLCRSDDPDYGYLWRNYCVAQWGVNFFSLLPMLVMYCLGWF